MAELARFQNFAKLKDTSVEFNDITVLAGKPSTGKSYVMKFVYAMKVNTDKQRETLNSYLEFSELIIEKSSSLSEIEQKTFLEKLKLLQNEIDSWGDPSQEDEKKIIQNIYKNTINSIFTNMSQISNNFEVTYKNITLSYFNDILNFKKNYNYKRKISNIIFVETPLILEFHKHMNRKKAKTPYHIESLLNILDKDYSSTDEEQDKFIKDFSQKANNIINGDIKNQNGSFIFSKNNDKNYDIFNTSSGTKSIGLLQYLVTNKALKKGSVLFWEEPEVHLHPEWQKKMIELFIELMNAGVKIVFSTHSAYMIEYLNALSKKRELTDRISFNLLKEENGIVENIILSNDNNWDLIQDELLNPLEEIAWEYL